MNKQLNNGELIYDNETEHSLGYENFILKFSQSIVIITENPNKNVIRTDKLGNKFLYQFNDGKYKIYWKPNGEGNFMVLKNGAHITSSYNMLNFQTTISIEIVDTE